MNYSPTTGDMYLIAPKLATIDGSYVADFQIQANNNSAMFQVGTISDNTDANTFSPIGSVLPVTDSFVLRNSGGIPASAHEYFAIKITTVVPHTSVRIDEFKWNEATVLSNDSFVSVDTETISLFPNPRDGRQISIQTSDNLEKQIAIYSLNGRQVFTAESNLRLIDLNLTSLSSSIYIVKIATSEASLVKKLILK